MNKNKVTVVGSLNIDHVLKVSNLPSLGQTLISETYDISEGGKGANQAVAIGRLGIDVDMIGKVGQDEPGKIMVESLRKSNVGCNGIFVVL